MDNKTGAKKRGRRPSEFSLAKLAHSCPRCQVKTAKPNHLLCASCEKAINIVAEGEQERAYLARWLATRVDAMGNPLDDTALTARPTDRRMAVRLVKMARRVGADWNSPPVPETYAAIVQRLTQPFRSQAALPFAS